MRSLAVVLGSNTVFLPWATEPKSFMSWPPRWNGIRHCRRRIGNACASALPGQASHDTLSTRSLLSRFRHTGTGCTAHAR